MSATTAVAQGARGRLGALVRTANQIHVYWTVPVDVPLVLRVTDLSGRAQAELLDGLGYRDLTVEPGHASCYVTGLPAGHLYVAELGAVTDGAFVPLLSAGPIQTAWAPGPDAGVFPAPYHRS